MKKNLKVLYIIVAIIVINFIGVANASANSISNPAQSEGLSGVQVVGAFVLMMVLMLLPLVKKSNPQVVKK